MAVCISSLQESKKWDLEEFNKWWRQIQELRPYIDVLYPDDPRIAQFVMVWYLSEVTPQDAVSEIKEFFIREDPCCSSEQFNEPRELDYLPSWDQGGPTYKSGCGIEVE